MQLTDEQAEVVKHRKGLLLVQARAGSGKTTTTCVHVKRIVEELRVSPDRILVCTFSRQGASDMRDKSETLGLPRGVDFKTLHATAYRVMRDARDSACAMREENKQPKMFTVIDGGARWKLNHILKKELYDQARRLGLGGDSRKRPAGVSVAHLRKYISKAKASIVGPRSYTVGASVFFEPGTKMPGFTEWAQQTLNMAKGPATLIGRVYEKYEKAKRNPFGYDPKKFVKDRGHQFLTFDDMVYHVARGVLLGSSWVEPFRGTYDWVFVDEVQDNSLGQWVIARHLSDDTNLVAIGDDMQSIYAFRGAVPQLMRRYLDEAGASMLTLTKNFRSRTEIINIANRVLLAAEEGLSDAIMHPGLADANQPADVKVRDYADASDEAFHVAEEISGKLAAQVDPREIAILYRTNAQSGPLEVEFLKRGIRYRIAGTSFFNRAEVRTCIAYLRLALNSSDDQAYERIYCVPLRGVGKAFLRDYPSYRFLRETLAQGRVRGMGRRGARELVDHVDRIAELLKKEGGLAKAIEYIDKTVGVRAHYRDEDAPEDDVTTVDESMGALLDCAKSLKDSKKLIEYAADMDGTRVEDSNGDASRRHMVTMSTVHRSKGLEWGTVYVLGVTQDVFPHKMGEYEEEMRLVYVALTRAKTSLRVSYTHYKINGGAGGASEAMDLIAPETVADFIPFE